MNLKLVICFLGLGIIICSCTSTIDNEKDSQTESKDGVIQLVSLALDELHFGYKEWSELTYMISLNKRDHWNKVHLAGFYQNNTLIVSIGDSRKVLTLLEIDTLPENSTKYTFFNDAFSAELVISKVKSYSSWDEMTGTLLINSKETGTSRNYENLYLTRTKNNLTTSIQKENSDERRYFTMESALNNKLKVKELNLGDEGLYKIPDKISALREIKTLSLSYNYISNIPKFLSKLEKLEELYLIDNEFTEIPEEICNIKNLKVLNMTANYVAKVPTCICELKHLKILAIETRTDKEIDKHLQSKLQDCLPNCRMSF